MADQRVADLCRVLSFLDRIGLHCRMATGSEGFLDKVRIRRGVLVVDPECPISNLLHEAGHLAIMPGQYRWLVGRDVDRAIKRMFKDLESEEPDSPLMRAALQSSDTEATAWAWAAGLEIGVPPERVILNCEYDGTGDQVRMGLGLRCYLGINGLAHAGMCTYPRGNTGYPAMLRWVQPVIVPTPTPLLP